MPRVAKCKNTYVLNEDGSASLTTSNGRTTFLISQKHLERVLQHTWYTNGYTKYGIYIVCTISYKRVFLHDFISYNDPTESGLHIDHKNGNTLDCRDDNLRPATQQQNNWNIRGNSDRLLPRGVQKIVLKNGDVHYRARITYFGKLISLGTSSSLSEVVSLREEAEQNYFGEFRRSEYVRVK